MSQVNVDKQYLRSVLELLLLPLCVGTCLVMYFVLNKCVLPSLAISMLRERERERERERVRERERERADCLNLIIFLAFICVCAFILQALPRGTKG